MSIIGNTYGKLTVVAYSEPYVKPSDGKREKRYLCRCECGGKTITAKRKLETGHTTSCGCLTKKHGLSKTDAYNVWNLMVQRCINPNFTKYHQYGGRGIKVCSRWLCDKTGFSTFIADMGQRPSDKHTIERVDVDGDYCPENCIWTDDTSLQGYNQTIRKSNTSGKTGVGYDRSKNSWYACIRKAGKTFKKSFHSFEEAATQRDVWEIELYGFNKK